MQLMFLFLAELSPKTEELTREALEKASGNSLITPDDAFMQQFFYMLTILALLIGAMLLTSWAIKKISSKRMDKLNDESGIKILDMRSLSPRTQLFVVEVEGKKHLVAESIGSTISLADT